MSFDSRILHHNNCPSLQNVKWRFKFGAKQKPSLTCVLRWSLHLLTNKLQCYRPYSLDFLLFSHQGQFVSLLGEWWTGTSTGRIIIVIDNPLWVHIRNLPATGPTVACLNSLDHKQVGLIYFSFLFPLYGKEDKIIIFPLLFGTYRKKKLKKQSLPLPNT